MAEKKVHLLEYFDFCPKCHEPFGGMMCGRDDEEGELESTLVESDVTCGNCLKAMKRKKEKEQRE